LSVPEADGDEGRLVADTAGSERQLKGASTQRQVSSRKLLGSAVDPRPSGVIRPLRSIAEKRSLKPQYGPYQAQRPVAGPQMER